jgi:hypothetical protein
MQMAVDPSDLDKLIKESGVGSRTAKKLREANKPAAVSGDKPTSSGHGAPAPALRIRGRL